MFEQTQRYTTWRKIETPGDGAEFFYFFPSDTEEGNGRKRIVVDDMT